MNRLRKFVLNGLLITIVSLLIRSVSVSFNVYISNKIGAVAMGLFTLISTVYGFAITVATSGIGLATTKLVAEALGKESQKDSTITNSPTLRCIVKKCVLYALCFSVATAVLLFVCAPWIGEHLLADTRTVLSLRVLAWTLPPIAISCVFSGYFIAVRRVYKNAIVQVLGQAAKIYACVILLSLFHARDVESACLAIVLGGALAEFFSFLAQYVFYLAEKRSRSSQSVSSSDRHQIQRSLLHIALPVAFSAYVRSGLITVEHMLIPWGLERSGSTRDLSLAAYGIVHSMVFPLVLFPSALSGSFAGLLVPEIAEAQAKGDTERINRIIGKVFYAVLIFAIGTAGILMCFSYALSDIVYPSANAGRYILMIAPLVPVMYLDTAVDSLLKGIGEQFYCMIVNIVDALLSVILVWFLLPRMGIVGYIITVYFTETINATLSITRLLQVSKVQTHPVRWVVQPLVCIVTATTLTRYLLTRWVGSVESVGSLIMQISITVLIYLFLLIVFHKRRSKRRKIRV